MKRLLIYIYLQFKMLLRLLPALIAGVAALSLMAGLIAFCGQKVFKEQSVYSYRIKAAIVPDDDSDLTDYLIQMLESTKSISDTCEFIETDYDTAKRLIRQKKVQCALIIPKGFTESVKTGRNLPIEIMFSDNGSMITLVLRQLSVAGADILASAQAGIYTQFDLYQKYNFFKENDEANEYLNKTFLKYVLQRQKMYKRSGSAISGSISIAEYYKCAGIGFVLLLIGIACPTFFSEENGVFDVYSSTCGIPYLFRVFSKIFIFVTICECALAVFLTPEEALKLLPAVFASVSLTALLYKLSSSGSVGIMVIFLLNFSSCLLSGYFLPKVFFPAYLQDFGDLLPSGMIFNQVQYALYDRPAHSLQLMVMSAILLMAAIISDTVTRRFS